MPKRMGTIKPLLHCPPLLSWCPWHAMKTAATIQKILVIYCNITEHSINNGSSIKQQLVLTYLNNF
jgi:hypothetical protein